MTVYLSSSIAESDCHDSVTCESQVARRYCVGDVRSGPSWGKPQDSQMSKLYEGKGESLGQSFVGDWEGSRVGSNLYMFMQWKFVVCLGPVS